MGFRRRRVNRRRRHGGWLTARGKVVLTAAVLAISIVVLGGGRSLFRTQAPLRPLPESQAARSAAGALPQPREEAPVYEQTAFVPEPAPTTLPADPPASPFTPSPPPANAAASALRSEGTVALPAVSAGPMRVGALFDPPRTRDRFEGARVQSGSVDPAAASRLVEWRSLGNREEAKLYGLGDQPLRVEYSLDEALTEQVFKILRKGRVENGTAILLDPRTGRLLSYVSTDEDLLPATRAYPAASIVKVLTAAAMLEEWGPRRESICTYRGNKYRLNRRRLERPSSGNESTLESALASSNNQCFAQWALHSVGEERLRSVFERFGWLASPAPGHEPGQIDPVETDLDLGRLGSGLDGVRVTPMHVAQLGTILTQGEWIEPWWIDRVVDADGQTVSLPARSPNRRVLDPEVADRLRTMMVSTTKRGTARSAFRDRRGRPRLGSIDVAGKTGNLSGRDPHGRYEWFLGLAPAEDPTIAVAVLQLQGHMWWRRSTELGADLLRAVFCDRNGCDRRNAARVTGDLGDWPMPLLISDLDRPSVLARIQ